jgi:putative ABC transport system permease protein
MVAEISWVALSWCLVPIIMVCIIYRVWDGNVNDVLIASTRMVLQLTVIGYVLIYLFVNPSIWISLTVVTVMITVAGWISIRPIKNHSGIFVSSLIALGVSVTLHLLISLKFVMQVENWYEPNILIPLAGMYFANTMNAISLSAERFFSEITNGKSLADAKLIAFRAAMIPQINSLLAVGVVALPGMMTGQILSGISPIIAVRYQIMIMAMLLGTCGLGAAIILWLLGRRGERDTQY